MLKFMGNFTTDFTINTDEKLCTEKTKQPVCVCECNLKLEELCCSPFFANSEFIMKIL